MLTCNHCKYTETNDDAFIGIFPAGTSLSDTNGHACGLYACPKCHSVIYTDDIDYIRKRKEQYKLQQKINKINKTVTKSDIDAWEKDKRAIASDWNKVGNTLRNIISH